jgi:hypothetical protein
MSQIFLIGKICPVILTICETKINFVLVFQYFYEIKVFQPCNKTGPDFLKMAWHHQIVSNLLFVKKIGALCYSFFFDI